MTHQATLADWHESLAKAVHDRAFDAVPGLLVLMAIDGYGHEAEEARRQMVTAKHRPSMAEQLGHDREAGKQLQMLLDTYRQGGINRLRGFVHITVDAAAPSAIELLLVEAVLTLAAPGTSPGRRAAEDFADAEAAAERTS
jgi:hypothetical protein